MKEMYATIRKICQGIMDTFPGTSDAAKHLTILNEFAIEFSRWMGKDYCPVIFTDMVTVADDAEEFTVKDIRNPQQYLFTISKDENSFTLELKSAAGRMSVEVAFDGWYIKHESSVEGSWTFEMGMMYQAFIDAFDHVNTIYPERIGLLSDDEMLMDKWNLSRGEWCNDDPTPYAGTPLLIDTDGKDIFPHNDGRIEFIINGNLLKSAIEVGKWCDKFHFVVDNGYGFRTFGVWDHSRCFTVQPEDGTVKIDEIADDKMYEVVLIGGWNYVHIHEFKEEK